MAKALDIPNSNNLFIYQTNVKQHITPWQSWITHCPAAIGQHHKTRARATGYSIKMAGHTKIKTTAKVKFAILRVKVSSCVIRQKSSSAIQIRFECKKKKSENTHCLGRHWTCVKRYSALSPSIPICTHRWPAFWIEPTLGSTVFSSH